MENWSLQFLPTIKIDCVWLCAYDLNFLDLLSAAVMGTHGTMAEIALADEQKVEQVTGECHHITVLTLGPQCRTDADQWE